MIEAGYEMIKLERIENIKKICEGKPESTGEKLTIRGKRETFNTYRIPLDFLIYNSRNGRFKSKFMTYLANHNHELNSENLEDSKIIAEFIWNSSESKNKSTLEDLRKKGQQRPGIITNDGRIIDGNRRYMLLSKLFEQDPSNLQFAYFETIVLPEDIDDKELVRLETEVQLGQDEKEGYGAIEKYLKVHELIDEFGYPQKTVSDLMKITEQKVNEYVEIYELFEEYLHHINRIGQYDLLEQIEDPIIQLRNAIDKLKRGTHPACLTRSISELDIVHLKTIVFDTIRIKPTGDHKIVRTILGSPKTKNADGIFGRKEIWKKFRNNHYQKYTEKVETFIKDKEEQLAQISTDKKQIIEEVENQVAKKFGSEFQKRITEANRDVSIAVSDDAPMHLIDQINSDSEKLFNDYYEIITSDYLNDKKFFERIKNILDKIEMIKRGIEECRLKR